MGKVFEGQIDGKGRRFAIVVSRFNDFITGRLLEGAQDALVRNGVAADDIDVAWVPGAFEIGFAAQALQRGSGKKGAPGTTRSSASARSSAGRRRTSNISRPRSPSAWRRSCWRGRHR